MSATDNIDAMGFAFFWPAMSGAEPCMGSKSPGIPGLPIDAEGSIPIEPVIMPARSERMSPNMLEVTMTSNVEGLPTSCIEQLST